MSAFVFRKQAGFTIVELLIVIVVIAILAAITIVSYNGIQNRANDTAVKADLRNFAVKMEVLKVDNADKYPTDFTAADGLKFSKSSYGLDSQSKNVRYCVNTTTNQYILYASSKSGQFFKATPTGAQETIAAAGWSICDQVGLSQVNPYPNGLSSPTWAAWTN